MLPYVWINDRLLTSEDALLPVTDLGLQRGYAVFDFFIVHEGNPVFMEDHLDRLQASAAFMRLPFPYSRETLRNMVKELIHKSSTLHCGIRITITGGMSADGFTIAAPACIITAHTLADQKAGHYESGIHLASYPYQRQFPAIKTTDYRNAIWLQPWITEKGADEVVYHQNNCITECPRANIFIVDNEGVLRTPVHHILKGVTRKKVLELSGSFFGLREDVISLGHLQHAEEVFITSTTKGILPVTRIDGKTIGTGKPGMITLELMNRLEELKRKNP